MIRRNMKDGDTEARSQRVETIRHTRGKRSLLIKAGVSAAFFVILFLTVRTVKLAETVRHIHPGYLVLSLLLIGVMISSSCLKWSVLLTHRGYRLPFGFLMKTYLIGYYFSNLLPSNIGGDIIRSYYVGRRIGNQSESAVNVFIERFSGILYLLLLVIVAPILKPALYSRLYVIVPAVGALGLITLVATLWLVKSPLAIPARIVDHCCAAARRVPWLGRTRAAEAAIRRCQRLAAKTFGHLHTFHVKMTDAVRTLSHAPGTAFKVVALTVLFYALTWVNVYLAYRTFRIEPSFIDIAAILPTAMLVAMVPISLGSLGLAEGSYVFYLLLVGIPPEASLAMALFLRLRLLLVGAVGYVFYLGRRETTNLSGLDAEG